MFEVAVLSKPSKNEVDAGAGAKLLFGPKAVVASDEKAAILAAGYAATSGDVEVLVRPFK